MTGREPDLLILAACLGVLLGTVCAAAAMVFGEQGVERVLNLFGLAVALVAVSLATTLAASGLWSEVRKFWRG